MVRSTSLQRTGVQNSGGRVAAHAAGIGAAVAVLQTLGVAGGNQRRKAFAVAEGENADLATLQPLLKQYGRSRVTEGTSRHAGAYRLGRLRRVVAYHHALACRQSVCLDHSGARIAAQVVQGLGFLSEHGKVRSGRIGCTDNLAGEAFAGLQLGRGARGAEYRNAGGGQRIRQARGQRRLRAHNDQVRSNLARGGDQPFESCTHVEVGGNPTRAVVAGSGPQSCQ